jgi:SAM-dependent methyltransferase
MSSAADDVRVPAASAAGFGGDMSVYERGRPSYPCDAVAWLVDGLGIGPGREVLDLAAGTGKLTRLLTSSGAHVTAVEPSAAMRAEFRRAVPGVEILDGTAESLSLADGSVDAITVAQAFHWFDVRAATAEMARVLVPGGGLGLIWNERDASVPWVAELSRIIRWDRRGEHRVPYTLEVDWVDVFARKVHAFGPLERFETRHTQRIDADTLVERVLSTSYLASSPETERRRIEREVRSVAADLPTSFELPYLTVAHRCWATSSR